jgi:SAM-dependent methyltransferase
MQHPNGGPSAAGNLADLVALLRCPRSGDELTLTEDGALLAPSGWSYPVVDGIPVLIDDEHSIVDVSWSVEGRADPEPAATPRSVVTGLLARVLRRLPSSNRNVAAARNFRRFVDLLEARATGRRPRVLIVGGRIEGAGTDVLLGRSDFEIVETDVAFGPRTDVICDGHDLPFADGIFDAVVIQAVLDCVIDPQRVAAQIHRVLASEGIVYSEVGFIQQAHTGAYDFNRLTHLGHRRLWRYFDEVDSGAQCGPGMALLWSTEYFFRAFVGQSRLMRAIVARGVALLGFWLKYLDHFLVGRPGGIDAASGTYFLGFRRETPLPDRAIVAGFRGILPHGQRLPKLHPQPVGHAAPVDEEIRAGRKATVRTTSSA